MNKITLEKAIETIQEACLEAMNGRNEYIYIKSGIMSSGTKVCEVYLSNTPAAQELLGEAWSMEVGTENVYDILQDSKRWEENTNSELIKRVDELIEKRDEITELINTIERQIIEGS